MVYSDPEKLNGRPDFGLFLFFLNFWSRNVAAGAFFCWRNTFLVLERCRRRLFLWKAVFLVLERCRRRLLLWKNCVLVLERCRRRFFLVEKRVFGLGTLPQAPFPNDFLHFPGPLPILGQLSRAKKISKRCQTSVEQYWQVWKSVKMWTSVNQLWQIKQLC